MGGVLSRPRCRRGSRQRTNDGVSDPPISSARQPAREGGSLTPSFVGVCAWTPRRVVSYRRNRPSQRSAWCKVRRRTCVQLTGNARTNRTITDVRPPPSSVTLAGLCARLAPAIAAGAIPHYAPHRRINYRAERNPTITRSMIGSLSFPSRRLAGARPAPQARLRP